VTALLEHRATSSPRERATRGAPGPDRCAIVYKQSGRTGEFQLVVAKMGSPLTCVARRRPSVHRRSVRCAGGGVGGSRTSSSYRASRPAGGGRSTPAERGTSWHSSACAVRVSAAGVRSSRSCGTRGRGGSWPRSSTATATRRRSWSLRPSARPAFGVSGHRWRLRPSSGSSSDGWILTAGGPAQLESTGTRCRCGDRSARLGRHALRDHVRDVPLESRYEMAAAALI
jgi:hypothetical protein